MITGSGWVAIGTGIPPLLRPTIVRCSTRRRRCRGASTRWGRRVVERQQLAGGHLTIGTQAMWQDNTQVNYFGIGPDVARPTIAASIGCRPTDVVGYATVTTKEWLSINGEFGWLGRPKLMNPGGTLQAGCPEHARRVCRTTRRRT